MDFFPTWLFIQGSEEEWELKQERKISQHPTLEIIYKIEFYFLYFIRTRQGDFKLHLNFVSNREVSGFTLQLLQVEYFNVCVCVCVFVVCVCLCMCGVCGFVYGQCMYLCLSMVCMYYVCVSVGMCVFVSVVCMYVGVCKCLCGQCVYICGMCVYLCVYCFPYSTTVAPPLFPGFGIQDGFLSKSQRNCPLKWTFILCLSSAFCPAPNFVAKLNSYRSGG